MVGEVTDSTEKAKTFVGGFLLWSIYAVMW